MNANMQNRLSDATSAVTNKVIAAWHRCWLRYPRWCKYLPPSITPDNVAIAAAMLAVLTAFAGGAGIIRLLPYQAAKADLGQLQQQEGLLKQNYRQRLPTAPRIDLLQKEQRQIEQRRALLRQQLTGNEEQEAVMAEIEAAGQARGLRFTMFKPGVKVKTAIQISAVGSYQAMARFIDDIAALPRLVLLDPLILQAGADDRKSPGSRLTLQATAIALQSDHPYDEHENHGLTALKAQKEQKARKHPRPLESNPNLRIAAMHDPFSPFAPLLATPLNASMQSASQSDSQLSSMHIRNAAGIGATAAIEEPAMLHLLGTIHDGNMVYALIEADKQVHCVALKAAVPSYPITIAGITEQAVQLDQLLADGSHRRSTLRQGE